MNQRQADNTVTLIDLLENKERDAYWDFSSVENCAVGYAERNQQLFDLKKAGGFYNDFQENIELNFGKQVEQYLYGFKSDGSGLSHSQIRKKTKQQVINGLKKIVSQNGWEAK